MLLQGFDSPVQQVPCDVQVLLRNKNGELARAEISGVAQVLFDFGFNWIEGIVGEGGIFHGGTDV